MNIHPDWWLAGAMVIGCLLLIMTSLYYLSDIVDTLRGKDDDKPRRSKEEPVEDDEDDRPVKKARRVEDE